MVSVRREPVRSELVWAACPLCDWHTFTSWFSRNGTLRMRLRNNLAKHMERAHHGMNPHLQSKILDEALEVLR